MIDLTKEEEHISRIAGIPFDQVLRLVDEKSPADLMDAYNAAADQYMLLAGKGRRTKEENITLDRLDSSLRLVLGENGLLCFVARLLRVFDAAKRGLAVFSHPQAEAQQLGEIRLNLGSAAALSRQHLQHTPLPVDAMLIVRLANRAVDAASALLDIRSHSHWWDFLLTDRRLVERTVMQFLNSLASNDPGSEPWLAAQHILDPQKTTPQQRLDRINLCYKMSGVFTCLAILQETGDKFQKAAELVRDGLAV